LNNITYITPEQQEALEKFAALDYTPRELAKIVGFNEDDFELDAATPGSEIYNIIEVAKLKAEGEISANLLNSAKTSVTAQQIYVKHQKNRERQSAKKRINESCPEQEKRPVLQRKYDEAKENFEALRELVMKGTPTEKYSEQMQEYWFRLKTAHELFLNFENIAKGRPYVVNLLKTRFEISEATAYRYINEAMDFFSMDLSMEVFDKYLISLLQKVVAYAWELDELKTLTECIKLMHEIAHKNQGEKLQFPEEVLKQKVMVITNDSGVLGVEPTSKEEIISFIKELGLKGLTRDEQRLIARDAGVMDYNNGD
jgi:hypothetical protein